MRIKKRTLLILTSLFLFAVLLFDSVPVYADPAIAVSSYLDIDTFASIEQRPELTDVDTARDSWSQTPRDLTVSARSSVADALGSVETLGTITSHWNDTLSGHVTFDLAYEIITPSRLNYANFSGTLPVGWFTERSEGWVYTFIAPEDGLFELYYDTNVTSQLNNGAESFVFNTEVTGGGYGFSGGSTRAIPDLSPATGTIHSGFLAGQTVTVNIGWPFGFQGTPPNIITSENTFMRQTAIFDWHLNYCDWRNQQPEPTPTPEPASMLLFGIGLIGVTGLRRKFQK